VATHSRVKQSNFFALIFRAEAISTNEMVLFF